MQPDLREQTPCLRPVTRAVLTRRRRLPADRSLLVAVSGIDGSGKGYVAEQLVAALERKGLGAVGLGADGWLNLPERRFNSARPAEHFYRNAFRFDEMFEQLALPLQRRRTLRLEANLVTEIATRYHRHVYDLEEVDVIVLEGIFLLKKEYRALYDLAVWVECSFETALERALRRQQEGLPPAETVRAYETIYFPAQRIHLRQDAPRENADYILKNDFRQQANDAGAFAPAEPLVAQEAAL